jgi:hypothetical protein
VASVADVLLAIPALPVEHLRTLVRAFREEPLAPRFLRRFASHPSADVDLWRKVVEVSAYDDITLLELLAERADARRDPWLRAQMERFASRRPGIHAALCRDGGPETRRVFRHLCTEHPQLAAGLLGDADFRANGIFHLERADIEPLLQDRGAEVRLAAIAALALLSPPPPPAATPAPPRR